MPVGGGAAAPAAAAGGAPAAAEEKKGTLQNIQSTIFNVKHQFCHDDQI